MAPMTRSRADFDGTGAGRRILRAARQCRVDRDRGHAALGGRAGLSDHARHPHRCAGRRLAQGHRRRPCQGRAYPCPAHACRAHVASRQYAASPAGGRALGHRARHRHVHPDRDAGHPDTARPDHRRSAPGPQDFRHAARRAIEAGADGVEIHGANAYLIQQVPGPQRQYAQRRNGDSIENRARFAIEVARAIADEIGADRTAIRFSPGITMWGIDIW